MDQLSFTEATKPATKKFTQAIVKDLKQRQEDFEFYPTTQEQIDVIKADIKLHTYTERAIDVLDCGAGDGRVLQQLTEGNRYAIEISETLRRQYNDDIVVLGTDFTEQSLIDKYVHLVFSNVPYTQMNVWAPKILNEAFSNAVVLILPTRWVKSTAIQQAIASRGWEAKVLGTYTYEEADREARAVVDVIRFFSPHNKYYDGGKSHTRDPFDNYFTHTFPGIKTKGSGSKGFFEESFKEQVEERLAKGFQSGSTSNAVSLRKEEVATLVESYETDLREIYAVFETIDALPQAVFDEMEGSFENLRRNFRAKVSSLKAVYWRNMMSSLPAITSLLTTSTQKHLLARILDNQNLDFTLGNVRAVALWIVQNFTQYIDSQFIEAVSKLDDAIDVKLYKSNRDLLVPSKKSWRWQCEAKAKYYFDYRCVLSPRYAFRESPSTDATFSTGELIVDLLAVAYNLGFDTSLNLDPMKMTFVYGETTEFYYYDHHSETKEVVFTIKVFRKGSMHVVFNKEFMIKMNVQFGRLKGWLHSAEQASDEIGIPLKKAECAFCALESIDQNSLLLG
ncbi:DUF4942 domain-containing protein [Vibrio tubiashii]|uniref:DUF4942 domain-containing protein n=1 Tax=Vibrio tubiashii TaxID=29498 RepID=UPI001EFE3C0F|nr:DUF4942 domain-containing protein [Vibrio tubiashii]MCG9576124.1 DUF4942 domain-containing protein [Vibrio tubiashii]